MKEHTLRKSKKCVAYPEPEHCVPRPRPGTMEVVEPAPERVARASLPPRVLAHLIRRLQQFRQIGIRTNFHIKQICKFTNKIKLLNM